MHMSSTTYFVSSCLELFLPSITFYYSQLTLSPLGMD